MIRELSPGSSLMAHQPRWRKYATAATRTRQPSTNPSHLRKAERSSGTEFRTFSFTYRDADDLRIPHFHTRGKTRGPSRGRCRSGGRTGRLRCRPGLRRRRPGHHPREGSRRQRQARCGRCRCSDRGAGQGREEHHHDGRHRARCDRAGHQAAGSRQGVRAGTYVRQARLRPRDRTDRDRRGDHQGGLEADVRPGHRSQAGDHARRPDALGRPGRRGGDDVHGHLPGAQQQDAA